MSGKFKDLFKTDKEESRHYDEVYGYAEDLADKRLQQRKEDSKNPFGNH